MSQTAECVSDPEPLPGIPASRIAPVRKRYPPGPRQALHRLSRLTQALDLQDQAYKAGIAKRTPIHVKAAFMRAWVDLQEIGMAIRGQGKPKPVEARNATKRNAKAQAAPIG